MVLLSEARARLRACSVLLNPVSVELEQQALRRRNKHQEDDLGPSSSSSTSNDSVDNPGCSRTSDPESSSPLCGLDMGEETMPSAPSPPGAVSASVEQSHCDEGANKLTTYLRQIAGISEPELDSVVKDHSYARPWNWRPENTYVKPAKKLFFPKNACSKEAASHGEPVLEVEKLNGKNLLPPYDLALAKQSMNEFQRVANFVRHEEYDDWEDRIDKILWSPVQNRIFNRIVRILNSERVARLVKANSLHEPIVRRVSIDTTANKFRETLGSANWDLRITQWLHSLLFDHLPQDYLAIYLDVLQTLRQKIPQLIDKMIAQQPNINCKGSSVSWETLAPLLKKTWDPVAHALNGSKPRKIPGNPILVIVPNGMSNTTSSRQQKWIAQLGALGTVVTVNSHLGLTANRMTVMAGLEQLVQASRATIQDVRADYPGRPIILIGFNSGAGLACQVSLMEHITAVVCVGFPFNTVDGKRGHPDDVLMDIRCPIMFVIGQHSDLARVDDIEEMRERMQVPTCLVVVGSADDHLRISTSKKISEKISQSMVDRCILDEMSDFICGVLILPHPLPLKSFGSVNNHDNRGRRNDVRKRGNSTSSSVDSEPQSPNIKKMRPHSPSQNQPQLQPHQITANNIAGISRNNIAASSNTASSQTHRRRFRGPIAQNHSNNQLVASKIGNQQQQHGDNSAGGITLNIGSFASLAPVGPIRFDSSSISLHSASLEKSHNNSNGTTSAKIPSTFIRVTKKDQPNTIEPRNLAKIRMVSPKKAPQRMPTAPTHVNMSEKTVNSHHIPMTTCSSQAKVGPDGGNIKPSPLICKSTVNAGGPSPGKLMSASSVAFTPKISPTVATIKSTSSPTMPPSKVAASVCSGDQEVIGGGSASVTTSTVSSKKHHTSGSSRGHQHHADRLSNSKSLSSVTGHATSASASSKRSPKARPTSKITTSPKGSTGSRPSSRAHPRPSAQARSGHTGTSVAYNASSSLNKSLGDGLENILDIPIIIANDESLNSIDSLSNLPVTTVENQSPLTANVPGIVLANQLVFFNKKAVSTSVNQSHKPNRVGSSYSKNASASQQSKQNSPQPSPIKYTKLVFTKKEDTDDNLLTSTTADDLIER
ncbi:hypothetical protein QAD02_022777 [Eretmocerus hayati]|uniref:Uncharacterized protein n=1 Tax=Eretmocerus hayati TaxID=131215 RepID=A0ACC2PVJ9_9HYME|nr:hypothetical protein QAD02_022777 [Eretmocerus hayati]